MLVVVWCDGEMWVSVVFDVVVLIEYVGKVYGVLLLE